MRSTDSAIISLYSTSVSGIVVLLNTKHWIKISRILFSTDSSFRPFWGKIFRDKISVSIFGQATELIGFIPWVESQSNYQKVNIQYLIFNNLFYIILYYTILYYTILYHTIPYHTIPYHTILYYTTLHYTTLHYTILYYTILYYTILYYTILYYTILVFASEVNSTLRALWLVHQTPAILYYPPRGAQAWRRALIRLIFEQFSLF